MALAASAACGVALAALLAAEWRESRTAGPGGRTVVWLAKPAASLAFLAAAWAWGAGDSAYGRTVLAALVLCLGGDVLLIPRERRGAFLAGIASFLLGHVVFGAAFAWRGVAPAALVAGLAGMAVFGLAVGRWLAPHLEGEMRVAVPAYVAVIGAMVALAVSATTATGDPLPALGAALFAVSDCFVARDRFVHPGFANAALGLPLYYGAQLLLAASVA